MKRLFDATVGRSLLVRVWVHGVLLFAGVIAMTLMMRWLASDLDQGMALRHAPYLASGVGERVLARRGDPQALAAELRTIERETPLSVSVFDRGGTHLGSSAGVLARPAQAADLRWHADRLVVTAPDGAYAVVATAAVPSVPVHALLLLGAALVLAFVFVAAPLTYSIARPLERLRALARELGEGNLAIRAKSTRRDEIGDLARTFDAMAAQLQDLRAAERQLLGDVSHELRTPLARMRVVLDLADDADVARTQRYLREVAIDLAELERLVDDIITSARLDPETARWSEARPPLRKRTVAVGDLVEATRARFRSRWPDRELVVAAPATPSFIDADPALLRRALDNLLDNACAHSTSAVELRVDDSVRFEVVDRGAGISEADQPRVFSAFFRADRSRSRSSGGVGLGLVLVRRIVDAHGGTVGFTSEADVGSRFWFQLAPISA